MGLSMLVRARGASACRRPSQRANALVRVQAGNAEAATSSRFPWHAEGEAAVTPEFEEEVSPLHGLRLKLERKAELRNGCCTNFAVVHASQGHAAELRCAGCGSHRGQLPKETANWLLVVLGHFPAAKTDVHVIRDTPATSARGGTGRSQREAKGTENE